MSTANELAITGARIVTGEGTVLERGSVVVAGGKVIAVREEDARGPSGSEALAWDADGLTLLPGFVDVHIHGGGGADTMDATPEALRAICRTHARSGTTGLLATTMTQSREAISAALGNAREAYQKGADFCPDGARVLGIHLEGPYISPERPGAQPKQFVRDYDAAEFAAWLDMTGDALKLITLAPERPGAADLIAVCRRRGIVVSLGHTDASAAVTEAALGAGATQGTHLYNAMPPLHHRKPGPIAVLLTDRRARVEIIADGHHVAPEAIRLVYAAKGANGIILITDAMAGAGVVGTGSHQGDGVYDLGGNAVTVKDGKALLPDGTLAGSVLTMAQAAANIRTWLNADWDSLVRLSSGNAAAQFGWPHKGRIASGADADLTLVDDDLTVHATFVAGRAVYRRPS